MSHGDTDATVSAVAGRQRSHKDAWQARISEARRRRAEALGRRNDSHRAVNALTCPKHVRRSPGAIFIRGLPHLAGGTLGVSLAFAVLSMAPNHDASTVGPVPKGAAAARGPLPPDPTSDAEPPVLAVQAAGPASADIPTDKSVRQGGDPLDLVAVIGGVVSDLPFGSPDYRPGDPETAAGSQASDGRQDGVGQNRDTADAFGTWASERIDKSGASARPSSGDSKAANAVEVTLVTGADAAFAGRELALREAVLSIDGDFVRTTGARTTIPPIRPKARRAAKPDATAKTFAAHTRQNRASEAARKVPKHATRRAPTQVSKNERGMRAAALRQRKALPRWARRTLRKNRGLRHAAEAAR